MKNISIKYRIYPNQTQSDQIMKTFGCVRFVYNKCLDYQERYYSRTKLFIKKIEMNSYCNHVLKQEFPFLREVDKFSITNSIFNLYESYNRYFTHLSKHPKYKSKKRSRMSYTTNITKENIEVGENYVKLPYLSKVKAIIHRKADSDWKIKTACVSRDRDGKFYCSIMYCINETEKINAININNAIGLDYSSKGLFVDSNGHTCDNLKHYSRYLKVLVREQRRLVRKQSEINHRPSKNYIKQQRKINRIHKKIANRRKDYLHKKSYEIANQYDIVCVESLNMRKISNKSFGLGKVTQDNGYGMFLEYLDYKLERKGKKLIRIDRWYPSSQLCSVNINIFFLKKGNIFLDSFLTPQSTEPLTMP